MKISICLFLAAAAKVVSGRDDIHILMFETDSSLENDPTSPLSFFKERSSFADLPTTVYGGGLEYNGFGDKYQTLKAILEVIDPSKLVVVADARDVALNIPENEKGANEAIDRFIDTYKKLTANDPLAVVMSAESQCCVSAMTHAHPSEYFDQVTMKRTKRACSSGKPGCTWEQNENIYAWVDVHRERAYQKTGIERIGDHVGDVYLNAGLMVGYPADLIYLLEVLDIAPSEDDQAVLSGLMYQFPDMIVLDYDQEMFGNNQWPRGLEEGCVFEKSVSDEEPTQSTLVHHETKVEPLIIHTPGKFYGCLDILIEELGGSSQQRYLQESPAGNPRILRREGKEVVRKLPAMNNDIDEASLAPSEADCECDCDHSRRRSLMNFLSKIFGSDKAQTMIPDDEPEVKTRNIEERDFERLIQEPDAVTDVAEAQDDTNYGNYGSYTNYGNYGQYGLYDGPEAQDTNYGNYGSYTNYGNYGNYGQYGVAGDSCADVCASKCSESGARSSNHDGNYGNYGSYGNYGNYGSYGNYGVRRRLH